MMGEAGARPCLFGKSMFDIIFSGIVGYYFPLIEYDGALTESG